MPDRTENYKHPFIKKKMKCRDCGQAFEILISHNPIANRIRLRRLRVDGRLLCKGCRKKAEKGE